MLLKSMLLGSTRIVYAPEDEKGVKAAEEKKPEDTKEEEDKKEDDKESDEDKDDESEEDEAGEKEAKEKTGEEDDEKKDEKEPSEAEKRILKLEKALDRLQRRVGKTTGERDEIARKLAQAEEALNKAVEDGKGFTDEEVNRRASKQAEQEVITREFKASEKRLVEAAVKVDKDFLRKINEVGQDIAPMPPFSVNILDELDNGGEVLAYLANNPDDYEEIIALSPVKMSRQLDKLSQKLEEEKKPKPKQISKVPKPNEPIGGGNKSADVLSEKQSMEDWVKTRNKQAEQHRKQKLGLV